MSERTYLDSIVAHHRQRAVNDSRQLAHLVSEARLRAPSRGFAGAIRATSHLAVIAEVKRRSPSKGDLAAGLNPALLASSYERGGASCLSVLTDGPHFGGSRQDLQSARDATRLPVLRKDFTVDARDVCDARIMGADCVLLIAAALSRAEMSQFIDVAREVEIDVLVEVHDLSELEDALTLGADLVGVNQRDLYSFAVDHDRALRMAAFIPENVVSVAESGIRDVADARSLREAGYDAILVGEHLVTSGDPEAAVRELCVP